MEDQGDLEVLEAARADLDEHRVVGRLPTNGRKGRVRDGDLPAVRGRRDTRGVVDVDADVVHAGRGQPTLAGVDADPNPRLGLVLVVPNDCQRAREGDRSGDRFGRVTEDG